MISGASLCLCLKSLVLIHILQATGLQMSVILKIKKSSVSLSVLHYSQSSTVLALKISLWYICYNFCVENGIFNFSEIFKFINNGYIKVALPKQIAVKR